MLKRALTATAGAQRHDDRASGFVWRSRDDGVRGVEGRPGSSKPEAVGDPPNRSTRKCSGAVVQITSLVLRERANTGRLTRVSSAFVDVQRLSFPLTYLASRFIVTPHAFRVAPCLVRLRPVPMHTDIRLSLPPSPDITSGTSIPPCEHDVHSLLRPLLSSTSISLLLPGPPSIRRGPRRGCFGCGCCAAPHDLKPSSAHTSARRRACC